MKSSFPGFFANGTQDIGRLWQECIFVLDANVLLSLYRFSDSTRTELLKVFTSLQERLWIPHHVASEYLANRLTVLGDQLKAYDDASRKVEALQKSLENLNQAPFVSESTQSEVVQVFNKLSGEFAEKRGVHDRRVYSDDIKDALEILFSGRVGKAFSREQMEQYIKDGEGRYSENIPPGFEDRKKGGDSELFSDRCKPYGDYFVWLQLIEKAKEDEVSIVFITGDVKDDWWLSFQGKTIGPLPALVEEFQQKTGRGFYMYTPHRFLERAKEHLQQDVSQVAVDEIKHSERHEVDRTDLKDKIVTYSSKYARASDFVNHLQAEKKRLLMEGKEMNARWGRAQMRKTELLSIIESLNPGVDDRTVELLYEEITKLDMLCSQLKSDLEHHHFRLAECMERLEEYRSAIEVKSS